MDLQTLFNQYYFLYRTEANGQAVGSDEYNIFVGLAQEAVNRWSNFDGTFWKELFDTAQTDGSADLTITANTLTYNAPNNMKMAGGFLKLFSVVNGVSTTKVRIPIIEPQEAQFQADLTSYCYFSGDPNNGFILNINPTPNSSWIGLSMDYIYYKLPTILSSPSDTTEMSEPYFIVHRALANRFRGSRNPYYTAAKNDAEDILKTMQLTNNSGNWANPWKLADNSGSEWGQAVGGNGLL